MFSYEVTVLSVIINAYSANLICVIIYMCFEIKSI